MSNYQSAGRQDESATTAIAHTVQDKAGEGASLVGGKAAEVGATAKEQATNVVGEATTQARDLAGELKTQLSDQAQTQTQRLAENVHRLSQELRDLGDNGKPGSTMADMARQLADGGHKIAARVEKRGPDGMVSDLQDFARRRPGAFLAGAALAGFVVARASKSVAATGSTTTPAHAPADQSATSAAARRSPASPGEPGLSQPPLPARSGTPAGYEDPLDTYGQSQPPHTVPTPPPYPPASRPPTADRLGGGV
ncbi:MULTISPECIES: hypothetical protein [unclassified Streptomyces]|uniref:hypothetical protein n=1 Tax=unclassified Streptomyces TaxID=2593676 RepID=UPI003654BDCB